jgi:hypothetical protein
MTTATMTRAEALLKLVALEPISRNDVILATGWGIHDTLAEVHALLASGQLAMFPESGGTILCTPAARQQALREHAAESYALRAVTLRRTREGLAC